MSWPRSTSTCAGRPGRIARDDGRMAHVLEPLLHTAKITHSVINNGDHGLRQQGIGTRSYRQVDIGNGSRFAPARINGHEQPLGVFGKLGKHYWCPRHLVALHPVPAPGHQHFRFMFVRTGDIVLLAEDAAGHPPGSAKFLASG